MKLTIRRILATEIKLVHELLADPEIASGALLGHTPSGSIDLVPFAADERNIVLIAEDEGTCWGAILFHWQEPGVYEVHTMAKPAARGKPYMHAVSDALRIMFLNSDCMELWTRVPAGNDAALGLVHWVQGRRMFESNGAAYYLLRWEDWLWHRGGANANLVARGVWFHERLQEQFAEQKREHALHADSTDHDRMVGATSELILNGIVGKAIILYNRWAKLAGYARVDIVVAQPLVVNIGDALLQVDFANRDFLLLAVRPDELRAA